MLLEISEFPFITKLNYMYAQLIPCWLAHVFPYPLGTCNNNGKEVFQLFRWQKFVSFSMSLLQFAFLVRKENLKDQIHKTNERIHTVPILILCGEKRGTAKFHTVQGYLRKIPNFKVSEIHKATIQWFCSQLLPCHLHSKQNKAKEQSEQQATTIRKSTESRVNF